MRSMATETPARSLAARPIESGVQTTAPADRGRGPHRAHWSVLFGIGLGSLMSGLDTSIVNAVVPVISQSLGVDVAATSWVVTTYLLVLACLLLTFGRLGDLHGHRPVYLSGFAAFLAGSALCGLAPNIGVLVGARAVQAVGAAMLLSTSPAILAASFPASQRGRAIGTLSAMTYLGIALGPSVGGWLSDQISWRAVFAVNLPIGLMAIVMSARFVPRDIARGSVEPFDVGGAVLFAIGLVLLLFGLDQGHDRGWLSMPILGCFAGAVLFLGLFVRRELAFPSPMLDLSLFRHWVFANAILSGVVNYIGAYSVLFLMPFYLIQARGLTPSEAGVHLMAFAVLMGITAPLSGTLSDRVGSRLPTTAGMVALAGGLFLLSRLGQQSPELYLEGALLLAGLGNGLFSSPNTSAALGAVPGERRGIASGCVATGRYVGMMLGIALAGAIFTSALAGAGATPSAPAVSSAVDAAFGATWVLAAGGAVLSAIRGGRRQRPVTA